MKSSYLIWNSWIDALLRISQTSWLYPACSWPHRSSMLFLCPSFFTPCQCGRTWILFHFVSYLFVILFLIIVDWGIKPNKILKHLQLNIGLGSFRHGLGGWKVLTKSCPSADRGGGWRGTHALLAKLLALPFRPYYYKKNFWTSVYCENDPRVKQHEGLLPSCYKCRRACHCEWRAHDHDKQAPAIYWPNHLEISLTPSVPFISHVTTLAETPSLSSVLPVRMSNGIF
jgi:hypothetical protein